MISLLVLVLSALFSAASCGDAEFPSWFKFGASSAAYQIEGAWNVSDKSESQWDRFTHVDPSRITDRSNGDVACDSYHLWRRDLEIAEELGLQVYRFSISWTRLLPTGFNNKISEDGKRYYNDLIDALIEKGIEPVVTLYHFDLPQNLQELGGWTNPLIVQWFADYARVAFTLFGDRVKTWITVNEIQIFCDFAFTTGIIAPGYIDPKISPHLCTKYVLLAHATAWRIYDREFKPLYHGKVSMSHNLVWLSPSTPKDESLAKLSMDYVIGRFCHPIFSKEGGWPASTIKLMEEASHKEGYSSSRLPKLSPQEIEFIKGTYDFFGLNYYTCRSVRRAKPGEQVPLFFVEGIPELNAVMEIDTTHSYAVSKYAAACPKGLRYLLSWLKQQYGEDLDILITENGIGTTDAGLNDDLRSTFLRDHLEEVMDSISLDGVNVTGYIFWTLMDNFEWMEGYSLKYGLYQVDFNSEMRTRTPKDSAKFYSSIIRKRSIKVKDCKAKQLLND